MSSSLSSPARRGAALTLALGAGLAVAPFAAAPAVAANHVEVVAWGLDNPRQLAIAATGDIFIAEAGTGGTGPCRPGPEGEICFGESGAVTRISGSTQHRVLDGLPSYAHPDGSQAIGPADVAATGGQKLSVLIGLGGEPDSVRALGPDSANHLATLVEANWRTGSMRTLADLGSHEVADNPIHDPDSNPVGFVRQGARYVVADAGGNTLVTATKQGATSTVAVFPDGSPVPAPPFLGLPPGATINPQAVPTSVAVGPDGAYYVSQLTGFPFPAGAANIWRVTADGTATVWASGLTNVTDLAFAADGSLYAVQLSDEGLLNGPFGSVVKVHPGGGHHTVADDLFAPYGIAISGDDAYVTVGAVVPGGGALVKVSLD